MSDMSPSFSLLRIFVIAVPAAAIAWGVKSYTDGFEQQAQEESFRTTVRQMLGSESQQVKLASRFTDRDGDLVADPPADRAQCVDPKEVAFSYYATIDEGNQKEIWGALLEDLAKRLGRPVNYVHYADVDEQLRAMNEGRLHIAAFGAGATTTAVNSAGFTPLACLADDQGQYSYTMKIIVPADSPIENIKQIRNQRVTFTRPKSNSGYKAALVMLMEEVDLQPERDYAWGFSYGHDNSIEGIAQKEFQVAAVASDVLERAISRGDVAADAIRVIHESEEYPAGVIGYAHNLTPELREGVRETFATFDLAGSAVEREFGAGRSLQFATVSYKDDWAPVRRINENVQAARQRFE